MYAVIGTWKMCSRGLYEACDMLAAGGTAGDAAVHTILQVENNPAYCSVGYGGLPDRDGHVMLDAAYMDGNTLRMGGIMSAENVQNPILAARKLCGREVNCLLAGRGAEQFAVENGLPLRDMRTESSLRRWQEAVQQDTKRLEAYRGHDTVCVLALDEQGGMAAGTSTSGLFMKAPGRVGDSPVIGSGFYCDSRYGAAAATGLGEDIMRGCLSYEIVSLMKRGASPKEDRAGGGRGQHQPDRPFSRRPLRRGHHPALLPLRGGGCKRHGPLRRGRGGRLPFRYGRRTGKRGLNFTPAGVEINKRRNTFMKKLLAIVLAVLMFALPALAMADELTMGSWRTDDMEQVTALLAKYEELTGVKIVFQPTQSTQYNATLRTQLDEKIGPDLFYSRSFSTGAELSENGFNVIVNDVPGVKENFTESALAAFTDANGNIFAVPLAAVSHFVYYNKAIFAENNIEIPATFEDFLAVCQQLKDAGIQPLSNGIAANWDILECVLCGMIPNYITAEERLAYESGEKKMNDETWVKIYSDFAKLVPFFPEAFASIDNDNANVMFGLGQSAMLIDGSWSYGTLAGDDYDIEVGFFPIPAPAGNAAGFSLHPDFGIAGNADSAHPEEVKAFLEWLASVEGAKITAEVIPDGFLPMINADVAPEGSIIADMNAAGEGKNADMRFVWSKMMSLYTPMVDELNAICRGEQTPEGAANAINALWEAELAK